MGTEPPIKPKEDAVIITIDDDEVNKAKQETTQELESIKSTIKEEREKLNGVKQATSNLPVNPDTGLPYTISYEGVNSYEDSTED
jgi:bifunctional DNA-binding transcriptional regulator/antitoxin component of YhaV-PrlF toxin-antitoxin module